MNDDQDHPSAAAERKTDDRVDAAGNRPFTSPIATVLRAVHGRFQNDATGALANYIPELAKADPQQFGIAVVTTDGHVYEVGDSRQEFTIQSISKPFVYGLALSDHDRGLVLDKIGVEPSGDAFNSILFDERHNRPFNPMVNAGAIAASALIRGDGYEARFGRILDLMSGFAGRPLTVDEAVFESERATGHRNRAIALLELNAGMIEEPVAEHLDLYFQQCSILVTAADLAVMAATLANGGVNPLTGQRVIGASIVRDMLSVMNSCGMYDYSGEWSFRIGLPAKSGVGGGIIAVLPGQLGIGTFSPLLDDRGNSHRGIQVCRELSERFHLHLFRSHPTQLAVIHRRYRGADVRSRRLRSPAERSILNRFGGEITVLEMQGDLYFASVERLFRDLAEDLAGTSYLLLGGKRVGRIDDAAAGLLVQLRDMLAAEGQRLLLATLQPEIKRLLAHSDGSAWPEPSFFPDVDSALEWCENRLIAAHAPGVAQQHSAAIAAMDLASGLSEEEIAAISGVVERFDYAPGEFLIREGDTADRLFLLSSGSVRVEIALPGSVGRKRITSIGPGVTFGELAMIAGGRRLADVVAETDATCFVLRVEHIAALDQTHPQLRMKLLTNIARELADRLRMANAEIRSLSG